MPVIPHRFLFRFSIPVPRVVPSAAVGRSFLDLDDCPALPELGGLDDAPAFAKVQAGWSDAGLAFRVVVAGKKMPIAETVDSPTESDGFQVWLDTRNTQTIHRATRFCHHFVFLPGEGKKSGSKATAHQIAIAQAKEDAPFTRSGLLKAAAQATPGGYVLDTWIPAECLHGFEPESNPLLGFYYVVRDAELGEQYLAVGRDFPFDHDPSLWSTLELTR